MTTATLEATEAGLTIAAADLDPMIHDATITMVSPKSGEHRTLRIETVRRGKLQGRRTVSLLTSGSDHYEAFAFIGDGGFAYTWRSRKGPDYQNPSMFEKYADMFNRRQYWAGRGVEYLISLQCRRCGRPLTHPDSINSGIGPICATR